MKNTIIVIGVIAAVIVAIYFAVRSAVTEVVAETEKDPVVRILNPVRGELSEMVDATGEVEPRTHINVSARVSATILELPFEEGDEVFVGDQTHERSVIAKLDDSDLRASLRSTRARRNAQEAQIRVAEVQLEARRAALQGLIANLEEAANDLRRQTYLLDTQDVARSLVDSAQARVADLEAQLESTRKGIEADELGLQVSRYNLDAADADIERAEENLKYTTIYAPINGVITRLNSEEGETVAGTIQNAGTVIMEIADLDDMLFIAHVDEADVGLVMLGQPATVDLQAYSDQQFTGIVESIALKQDQGQNNTKIYKTEIALDTNGQRIYTGLTGDAQIEVARHTDVLKVPTQAILGARVDELPADIREGNELVDRDKTITAVVYRYIDGKAVVTPVTIGPSDSTDTIVTAGITEQDRVIVGPYKVLESLTHDKKVIDEKDAPAGAAEAQTAAAAAQRSAESSAPPRRR